MTLQSHMAAEGIEANTQPAALELVPVVVSLSLTAAVAEVLMKYFDRIDE